MEEEVFVVVEGRVHVHVIYSEGQAGIDLVFPVEGDVEVILLNASPGDALVVVGIRAVEAVGLSVEVHSLKVGELCVVGGVDDGQHVVAVSVVVEVKAVGELAEDVGLRPSVGLSAEDFGVVFEVAAFLVVEAEVDEFEFSLAGHFHGIDKACLVKTASDFVDVHGESCVRLRDATCTQRGVAFPEHTDAGGVGAHGGEVCAEGVHRATHADEACRSVEVAAGESLHFVDVLCLQGAAEQTCHCQRIIFSKHDFSVFSGVHFGVTAGNRRRADSLCGLDMC